MIILIGYTVATNVKTKQWGNSIGIIIPKDLVNDLSLVPGEEVAIEISKKQNVLKELFGALNWGKDKQKVLKEVRKELEGKWL